MAVKIQLRRDTSENWSSNNPVLSLGEPAVDTTELLFKIGDGTTNWNSLPYLEITDSPTFENIIISNDFTVLGQSLDDIDLLEGKEYKIDGASILSSTTLGSSVVNSSLTSLGVVTSGTWEATDVGLGHGGTGATLTATEGGVVYSTDSSMAITDAGNSGEVLTSNGTSAPTWQEVDLGFNAFLLAGM
jgi:hypothetical protein